MTLRLNRDFRELLECFGARDVRFLVVGGHALAVHGHPRYTKDLDLWVWMDDSNAQLAVAALDDFGFGSLDLTPADFCTPDTVIQLGYPPNRVDLLTSPSGVDFETCWADRIDVEIDGLSVPFIGREGLIANKRAAGRPQDLLDVAELEARS
jgi:predicted nucleotidyltransferase